MSTRSRILIGLLLLLFVTMLVVPALAQDGLLQTNTPTIIATSGSVVVAPPAEATAVSTLVLTPPAPTSSAPQETAQPTDNSHVWIISDDLKPYLWGIFILGSILILSLFATSMFFSYHHVPAWLRPVVPLAIAAGDAGVAQVDNYLLNNKVKWDDGLSAPLDGSWEALKKRIQNGELVVMPAGIKADLISQNPPNSDSSNMGQGLVEYALILVLVAVVVIVILALLGPAIGNIFSNLVNSL